MQQLFYSTGQVARQLGITLATVRFLCENGVIAAETTPGGQ
jgi:excisionase family DNA binding protein